METAQFTVTDFATGKSVTFSSDTDAYSVASKLIWRLDLYGRGIERPAYLMVRALLNGQDATKYAAICGFRVCQGRRGTA